MKKTQLKAKTPLKQRVSLKSRQSLKSAGVRSAAMTKSKKPSVAKLKKDADKYYSKATRYRFAEKRGDTWYAECITCGVEKPIKQLQCGHFMSRRHNILRYRDENTAAQCYGCNVMSQGRQYEFGLAIDDLYGAGTAKALHEESKQLHTLTVDELQEIIRDAKEQIKFYEGQK